MAQHLPTSSWKYERGRSADSRVSICLLVRRVVQGLLSARCPLAFYSSLTLGYMGDTSSRGEPSPESVVLDERVEFALLACESTQVLLEPRKVESSFGQIVSQKDVSRSTQVKYSHIFGTGPHIPTSRLPV